MNTYKVKCSGSIVIEIEAESEDEAVEQAMLRIENYMTHEIVDNYEIEKEIG